jgi:PAS domain S-box-containing protein
VNVVAINEGQTDTIGNCHGPPSLVGIAGLMPQLLEMVNDLVFSLAPDGSRLLFINRTAERIYGRPIGELIQSSDLWIECVHEQDRAELLDSIAQIGQTLEFERTFRVVQPEGQVRTLQGRFCPVQSENGSLAAIGCIAKDVTYRIQAEQELEESKAIYHSLVESLPINVFRKDREGRIVFVNNKYCDTIGRTREELIGKTDYDLYEPRLAEKYLNDDRWVLQTGLPFHDVEFHQKSHDQYIYVEVLKAPVTSANGRRIGIQGMFWDVTDRKKAEIELQNAKDAAVAASQAKSEFLANVSHEIRTPLNAVIGIAELLLGSKLNEPQREYLQMIHDSGQSLLTLINDILDFSKIESGKLVIDSEWFDLREKVGDILRSLAVRAYSKNIELICNIDPCIPTQLLGDPQRLRQVLINLVGNAIKFTHQGEICLDVEQTACQHKTCSVKFRVQDTGIGIPEDKLTSIFESFVQGDASTTRQYGGTGLGLTIASQLVDLMGSELKVTSRVGKGTEFYFALEFPISSTAQPPVPPHDLNEVPVLIMVANNSSRESLDCVLKSWRMKTFCAPDVEQAAQLIKGMAFADQPIRIVLAESPSVSAEDPHHDCLALAKRVSDESEILMPVFVSLIKSTSPDSPHDQASGIARRLLLPAKYSELKSVILACLGSASEATSVDREQAVPAQATYKILLAEDNPVNQKLAVGVLSKAGHSVTVVDNGRKAVSILEQESFDLVLMDVQMPEMDGIQATRIIRSRTNERTSRIPIIAMTAHAMPSDRKRCLESGMDDYLSKPFRAGDLLRLIEQWVAQRSRDSQEKSGFQQPVTRYEIDWNQAFETVGGDRKLLAELIEIFQVERYSMIADLQRAAEQRNHAEVRRNAHSIKGALNHLGATAAAHCASQIENLSADEVSHAAQLILELRDRVDQLTNEFQRFTNSLYTTGSN